MFSFEELVDRLVSRAQQIEPTLDNYIKTKGNELLQEMRDGPLKIVDCVKGLNPILTSGDHEIRAYGVKLLMHVITQLPHGSLNEKEIETLTEFMCLRLIDHKSMEVAALKSLSYFVDCVNKPHDYNKKLVDFIKTKANPHRMDARARRSIYELLKKILVEKRSQTRQIDGDLVYSLVSIMENENNPNNLLFCFGMISYVLKNFTELEPYMDDIFEWLSAYYPVDYTPSEKENSEAINIQRSDLVQALYDCFYATPLNADNLLTLLLEKLDSNVTQSKLESLECLIRCYEQFPLESIQKYNSTLWTAVRMSCLHKLDAVDPRLMDLSLRTLAVLGKRLSENGELYFTFISDMYEELAIAFRKPEMDLFEPAAKLLTQAILPSMIGFNYVLDKILIIAINALEVNEIRPLPGLTYIFEHLHKHHPGEKLREDLNTLSKKLLIKVLDKMSSDDSSRLALIETLIRQKIALTENDQNEIIKKLRELNVKANIDIEKCLALLSINYRRPDIICHEELADYGLDSLIRIVHGFELNELLADKRDTPTSSFPTSLSKLSVYMRLLILQLNECHPIEIDAIDQQILNQSLVRMRELASSLENQSITYRVALVHLIVVNKLDAQSISKIVMDIFSSDYCQKFVPTDEKSRAKTTDVYLPLIKRVFKSLVIRNHQLASPLINLFLNFITSDKVDLHLAMEGSRVFSYVQSDDGKSFNLARHYKVFFLYRQKFYTLTNKEIQIRMEKEVDDTKKDLLLCALALQIPHLPFAAYKRDYEWLIRQLLRVLLRYKNGRENNESGETIATSPEQQEMFSVLFGCLENFIQRDLAEHLVSFLPSLIDLCLENARKASSLQMRKEALLCLTKIAASFKDQDLLAYRPKVVDELRTSLADKKRFVRQAAAEARLRWIVIGQPVGSI